MAKIFFFFFHETNWRVKFGGFYLAGLLRDSKGSEQENDKNALSTATFGYIKGQGFARKGVESICYQPTANGIVLCGMGGEDDYRFMAIEDAMASLNQKVNIIGVVVEMGMPKRSKGTGTIFKHLFFWFFFLKEK